MPALGINVYGSSDVILPTVPLFMRFTLRLGGAISASPNASGFTTAEYTNIEPRGFVYKHYDFRNPEPRFQSQSERASLKILR